MKNLGILFSCFFFFSFGSFAQNTEVNVGDQKPSSEVFGEQEAWEDLNASIDTVRLFTLQEIMSLKSLKLGDQILVWNDIDGFLAEAQLFDPKDQIYVLKKGGKRYFYKPNSESRLRYIKIISATTNSVVEKKKPTTPATSSTSVVKNEDEDEDEKTLDLSKKQSRQLRRHGQTEFVENGETYIVKMTDSKTISIALKGNNNRIKIKNKENHYHNDYDNGYLGYRVIRTQTFGHAHSEQATQYYFNNGRGSSTFGEFGTDSYGHWYHNKRY